MKIKPLSKHIQLTDDCNYQIHILVHNDGFISIFPYNPDLKEKIKEAGVGICSDPDHFVFKKTRPMVLKALGQLLIKASEMTDDVL